MKVIIIGGVAAERRARRDCAGWMRRRKSSWSSAGRTCRTRTAACRTTSAASSRRSRASSWPLSRCSARCSTSTRDAVRASRSRRQEDRRSEELATGEVTTEPYDKLVLSPGAAPIRPPLPGIDLPGIFSVRTVPDARTIRAWCIAARRARPAWTPTRVPDRHEAEARRRGWRRVHRPRDGGELRPPGPGCHAHREAEPGDAAARPEMARLVERYLVKHGVNLQLSDGVAGFRQTAEGALEVLTESGKAHPADIVILAIGVRPRPRWRKRPASKSASGWHPRRRAHAHERPNIFAVGDAVEVKDFVTGQWTLIPLADRRTGRAHRRRRDRRARLALRGTQGTSICKIFEARSARPGPARRCCGRWGDGVREGLHLSELPRGYYPGAKMMAIKCSSARPTGACSARSCSPRTASPSGRRVCDGHPDAGHHRRPGGSDCATRRRSAAQGPVNFAGWSRATSSPATCRLSTGTAPARGSSSTYATRRVGGRVRPRRTQHPLPQLRARLGELPRDKRSRSSAAPPCAPTTPRASCWQTASRHGTSRAACWPGRIAPRREGGQEICR